MVPDASGRGPDTPIPRAKGWPGVGVLPYLAKDPFGFCLQSALAGDGLVRLDVGPMKIYLVSHPDYVHRVLVSGAANYGKGSIMNGIRLALGNGLFTSDGDAWKRQRRLLQPTFHQRHLESTIRTVNEELSDTLRRWQPAIASGEPVDLLSDVIQLNIRITLRVLFGATASADEAARLLVDTDAVFRGMARRVWTFFLPPWLPAPGARQYRRAIRTLDEHIYEIVAARRAAPEQHADLLGALLASQDDTGEGLNDEQIRDEIFTFFLAGYESTASNIAWTFCQLAAHPEVMREVQDEVDRILGTRAPAYTDLVNLVFERMVIREALRLYPAFPMFFRTSADTDTLGPYTLPAGSSIVLSPYATHHDARYWADPEKFDPGRFSTERFGPQEKNAYYPFGKGQRICIGEAMALTIAQIVIAAIVQAFDVEILGGSSVKGHYAMTYTPKNGLPIILRPRREFGNNPEFAR